MQSPGETIYMPNYQAHAVYNLDETVAVGDNPFFNTAIEESAFDLFHRKINEKHGIGCGKSPKKS